MMKLSAPKQAVVAIIVILLLGAGYIFNTIGWDANCDPKEFSETLALEFSRSLLAVGEYNSEELSDLEVVSFFEQSSASPPMFQYELTGDLRGKETRFSGLGNGCGILELDNLGRPPPPIVYHPETENLE